MESTVSQAPPLPPQPSGDGSLKRASLPLFQAKGWMRFLGVMSVLEGVVDILSVVGIIVAWLPIWLGVLLFQAAGEVERSYQTGDALLLESCHRRLKLYFVIRGITILVQIALFILAISFFGTLGLLGILGEVANS